MNYTFQFGTVMDRLPELLAGAVADDPSVGVRDDVRPADRHSPASIGKVYGSRPVRWLVNAYVEFIRNTPFLIQLYFVFFALPHFGIRMSPNTAALVAMVINLGAYSTEIVRAGVEAIPEGQIEAGRALGLSRFQIVRFIVLFPALKAVYPALTSQFILVLLGSSIVSAIAAEELTAVANTINSQTFRSFEIYGIVTVIYIAIVFGFRAAFTIDLRPDFREARMTARGPSVIAFLHMARGLAAAPGGPMDDRALPLRPSSAGGRSASLSPSRGCAPSGRCAISRPGYIQLVQAIPALMLLLLFYYGLNLFGIRVDAWTAAILAFTLSTSAFLAEIWRGCLQAVPLGQWDAALSLGLNFRRTLALVILPQAVRMALPPTVGYMVQVVKGTSLAALIGFTELAKAGTQINTITFEPILVFGTVAIIYFAMCWPLSLLSHHLERRLKVGHVRVQAL